MSKDWGKARILALWGHFAGSITPVWHGQADTYLVSILNYVLTGNRSWQGKKSVSARLNYLWILRNTRCLRENLRKFVQPPVRKPHSMGRHSQQSGHDSDLWRDLYFLLSFIFCPRSEHWSICILLLFPPHCWVEYSMAPLLVCTRQPPAQMKRKHLNNIWGLNIIFKLIQEILSVCPEFRNSLIWDGSKMKCCIWCNHNIVKAVIPTASSSWQQLKMISHGTFCAAAAFID